ncbi:hypothetical protein B9G69_006745 [Bdellovibrio sp. SKB1291214]|uniref:hypothetical protein n=1 Tax=Bdellovibrio sp. SKB1291214 TaxID=1732569 RepID=UPI000B51D76D|nr:hypothetical protein [Bdellovibrio sp. SKB1291214]UYL10275.1 hypothetical protein B9G69_006745 [Bdellovibrio sp. SKB1291214]
MKAFIFVSVLCTSVLAQATPPTKDYRCADKSGNSIAWDVINYNAANDVQDVHSDVYITIKGVKYTVSSERALATPYQPMLLLKDDRAEQYVIVKPVGPVSYTESEIRGAAEVEFAVKSSQGLFKNKIRMQCAGSNDV